MSKQYDPEVRKQIERVLDVFKDHIQTSPHYEILWSDKMGYIYLTVDEERGIVADRGGFVIENGAEIFDRLLYEVAVDIMEEIGHDLDPTEATPLEQKEIVRRLQPYTEQTPAYQDRVDRLFRREDE